ncbi:MAG: transglycosylase SLT domain-containing protein [Chitinophagales bacterium]|nr:transglycosylase SLT domain-containing protein [Chitinophagales bacterium]MCZ2392790.1 transglycosylase SLT domain-containing protein [Chitinophagales bacterium]
MTKPKTLIYSLIILAIIILGFAIYHKYFQASDIQKIKERGVLKLVTAYNPTGYFLYKEEPMGFEHDFIYNYAKKLGVKLEVIVVNQPEEMRRKLLNGEADIMAYNIPIVNLPMRFIEFSRPYVQTELVLVQRKVNKKSPEYIGSISSLTGKIISITEQSAYGQTLSDIKFELNNQLQVQTIGESKTPEDLIRMVSENEIAYTVANKEIALINKEYFDNIDIETTLTPPQDIAFAIHRKNKNLLDDLNHFIDNSRKDKTLYALYDQYFKTSRFITDKDGKDLVASSNNLNQSISVYDPIVQKYAREINWDWRLIASLIWQESRYKPTAKSWAGAVGLMQLMPATARRFGLNSMQEIYHPELNIKTGTKYIAWLENFWKEIKDETERKKFILASYNAGEGHVKDAQRLAQKYGYDSNKWDGNVEYFLLNKSKPAFYRDPVCKYGYCRGSEPFFYVRKIIEKYASLKLQYSAEHNSGYDFSLDFSPIYEMGVEENTSTFGIKKHQLFEKREIFQETDTQKGFNHLTPKNPERIQLKKNATPSNQLFKKNKLFRSSE